MEIKRFLADNVREGMLSVRSLLGPEAVILSNRRVGQKIEILATNQFDADALAVSDVTKKSKVEVSDFGDARQRASATPIAPEQPREPVPMAQGPAALSSDASEGSTNQVAYKAATPDAIAQPAPVAVKNSWSEQIPDLGARLPGLGAKTVGPRQGVAVPKLQEISGLGTETLNGLQQELGNLKTLLVGELAKLRAEQSGSQAAVTQARLRLSELGLNPFSLDQLMGDFDAQRFEACDSVVNQWQQLLDLVGSQLNAVDEEVIDKGGVFAVIGTTGVGKTTTVAKLAARYALKHGRESVALITTDAFKMGGQDQLLTFGKLLNIPVEVAVDAEQLTNALKRAMDKKLVLIDSAGMSERDIKLNRHLSRIKMHDAYPKNILIVSATSQLGLAEQVISQYDHAEVHAAILTKTDEAINLGSGLSTLLKSQLPLAYSCYGQGLSDIRLAKITSLLTDAFAMMKRAQVAEPITSRDEQIHA
jgi:flagellar biosynthesis protein FlhF